MYFSGIDVDIYVYYPTPVKQLDAVDIQFSINQTASPIYSHAATRADIKGNKTHEHEYSTVMRGTGLVQGTLVLNLTNDKTLPDFMNEELSLLINMKNEGFEKDNDPGSFYDFEEHQKGYTIDGVNIISRNHTIHPSAENVVEVLHFVAREFTPIV